jgi:hypothetical protein
MKASQIQIESQISILLKGSPGFGKTIAAASFALDGPVYLFYFDKKSPIELFSFYSRFGEVGKKILNNIEYDIYSAKNANEYLNKLISFTKDCRYTTIITDSITSLTSAAVNWSLSFRDDRKNKDKLKVLPDFDEYKVETSLVSQSLDISRTLPCNIIWTAHPIPGIRIEGSGASIKITKVNPIVSYGSKVAGIIPGSFSEIYQFSKSNVWDAVTGKNSIKYLVSTDAIGDDYAKSNIGLKGEFDITGVLFYEVWKEEVRKLKEELNDLKKLESEKPIPYTNIITNPSTIESNQSNKAWNSTTGKYE